MEGQPVLGADLNCSESRCCVALPHLGRWPIGVKAERLAVSIFSLNCVQEQISSRRSWRFPKCQNPPCGAFASLRT